jgi:hypothetical protein
VWHATARQAGCGPAWTGPVGPGREWPGMAGTARHAMEWKVQEWWARQGRRGGDRRGRAGTGPARPGSEGFGRRGWGCRRGAWKGEAWQARMGNARAGAAVLVVDGKGGRGMAGRAVMPGIGMERKGGARQRSSRQGRHGADGEAGRFMARQAGPVLVRPGGARLGTAWQAWLGTPGQGAARSGKARLGAAGEAWNGQDRSDRLGTAGRGVGARLGTAWNGGVRHGRHGRITNDEHARRPPQLRRRHPRL